MTAHYSDQVTKIDAGTKLDAGENGGRTRSFQGDDVASAAATGDTFELTRIPIGHRIIDMWLAHDALGTGVTIAIGDGTTADKYKAAAAAASAGVLRDMKVAALGVKLTAQEKIVGTVGGTAANGTMKLFVLTSAP